MAERPNELWVADITFLPTLAGFLYLLAERPLNRASLLDGEHKRLTHS
jgi:hypothetical protein